MQSRSLRRSGSSLQSLADYICLFHQGCVRIARQIVRSCQAGYCPTGHDMANEERWVESSGHPSLTRSVVMDYHMLQYGRDLMFLDISSQSCPSWKALDNSPLSATRIDNCMF
jgi:hypothetical protein